MDQRDYRRALACFPTGVTVVAALDDDGEPWGLTANAFTSVSLDPPLILVCLDRRGRTWPIFATSEGVSINILAGDQEALARHFAGTTPNRFASVAWKREGSSAPVLHGTAAWLDCRIEQRIDAGDHVIILGAVRQFGHSSRPPLGYCRGAFVSITNQQTAPDSKGLCDA